MTRTKDFLILLTRLFLGYIFVSAGFCKLTHGHFGQLIGPPWLEERLAEYGLAMFARVVAWSQIVCGVLLLSQRFSILGAIMLFPMNVSILAVTISMDWHGTPYINAVFLVLNLMLLLYEWPKFRFLFHPGTFTVLPDPLDELRKSVLNIAALVLFAVGALVASAGIYVTAAFVFCLALITLAIPLIRSGLFSVVEKVLIAQSILNMLLVTLAFGNDLITAAVGVNTGGIALLLTWWAVSKARKKEPVVQAPENFFV
ncbi:MAG TPA: DoxX family membrane protein [Sphingobacteriaceae bacterium]